MDARALIEVEVGWDLGAAWLEGAKMRRWSAEVWVESRLPTIWVMVNNDLENTIRLLVLML